jgi:hypothetical protein
LHDYIAACCIDAVARQHEMLRAVGLRIPFRSRI